MSELKLGNGTNDEQRECTEVHSTSAEPVFSTSRHTPSGSRLRNNAQARQDARSARLTRSTTRRAPRVPDRPCGALRRSEGVLADSAILPRPARNVAPPTTERPGGSWTDAGSDPIGGR